MTPPKLIATVTGGVAFGPGLKAALDAAMVAFSEKYRVAAFTATPTAENPEEIDFTMVLEPKCSMLDPYWDGDLIRAVSLAVTGLSPEKTIMIQKG